MCSKASLVQETSRHDGDPIKQTPVFLLRTIQLQSRKVALSSLVDWVSVLCQTKEDNN